MENMKYGVWLVWLGCPVLMIFSGGLLGTIASAVFWLTLIAHVVEFLVKRPLFERAGGSMGHHFVQTMIYGLFHWKPIEERLAEAAE